jgi:hypothetical protein
MYPASESEPDVNLPQQRSNVLIWGGSILVVLLIGAGALYVYMKVLPSRTGGEPSGTSSTSQTPPQIVDFKQTNTAPGTSKYVLPKSKVTPLYYSIYNNIANEMVALMRVYKDDMFPLLEQSKTAAKNKDYSLLQTLSGKVKIINDAQKVRLATLSANFDNLTAASRALTDQKTILLTNSFITSGKDMVAKYSVMATIVDNMMSGKVSTDMVADMQAASSALAPATTLFYTDATKLSDYFAATIIHDANEYLATHPVATSTVKN